MAHSATRGDVIKVVSFNLRRDFGPQRKNKWDTRKDYAAQLIQDSGAAIIGVQEFLPKMRKDMKQLLHGYSIFGRGRTNGKKEKNDEHSDIILKNEDVELITCRTFWLSKNPESPSRAYYAPFPRICTVAEVRLKNSGERIRVFNAHFDHICSMARTLSVKMILEKINEMNDRDPLPTIVMGDFNARPDSYAVRYIRDKLYSYSNVHLNDIYGYVDKLIGNTYHGFKGKIKTKFKPIDYIFVSDEFEIVNAVVDTSSFDGQYPSDHYPIAATLRLKEEYLNRNQDIRKNA